MLHICTYRITCTKHFRHPKHLTVYYSKLNKEFKAIGTIYKILTYCNVFTHAHQGQFRCLFISDNFSYVVSDCILYIHMVWLIVR